MQFKDIVEETALQEAAIHDRYCMDLLKKHLSNLEMNMTTSSSLDPYRETLERAGLYLEHRVEPGDAGAELHSYRLYKLVDSSPRYRIKRVMAIEVEGQEQQ